MRILFLVRTAALVLVLQLLTGITDAIAQVVDTLPKITVTASQIDFGNTALGSSRQKSFLVINSSDTALTLTGDVSNVAPPFGIDSGGGAFFLDSAASKRVYVSFNPVTLGSYLDSIVIASNSDSASNRVVVYITGTGFIPDTVAKISVSPASLDYGITYTGFSKPMEFVIKNVTNTRIKITGNIVNAHPPFYVTSGLGNFQLDSGQSKTITVQSAPDQVGTFFDSVIITTDLDSPYNRIVVPLTAVVKSQDILKPQMSLTAADTINFGQMSPNDGQTLILFFTIKNISDSERVLQTKLLEPHGFFTLLGPTELNLNRFESQQYRVGFSPKAPGEFLDSIIVISNTPNPRIPIYLKAKVIPTGAVKNEETEALSIVAFPNPARDVVLLRFSTDKIVKPVCQVFDHNGKEVLSMALAETTAGNNAMLFDVSKLSSGTYLVRVNGLSEALATVRVVIQK